MRKSSIVPIEGHEFRFTRNWFLNRNLPTYRDRILPVWQGKPVRFLEIGVYEGMSLVWTMQYVLTHPDSRAVGVDPWLMSTKLSSEHMEQAMKRAFHNLSPWSDRCRLVRGNSSEVLRKMAGRKGYLGVAGRGGGNLDLCIVDGDHHELLVLDDARLCLRLVRRGGWIVFDDVENDREKTGHVKQAVRTFVEESRGRTKLVWKDRYMEAYERL